MTMQTMNIDIKGPDANAQAFAATARYNNDAELMKLANNGMRPLAVGNTGACPPNGRPVPNGIPCPPACPVKPPRCDCHVVGGNTLGTTGIATGATAALRFGAVTIDSGDAQRFVPYYMYVTAFQFNSATTTTGTPVMVLLQDSKSGQEPNLRRASGTNPSFGIATLVYGREKELECVDWKSFASVNNQELRLSFYNPRDFAVHVFVSLWGVPVAGQ